MSNHSYFVNSSIVFIQSGAHVTNSIAVVPSAPNLFESFKVRVNVSDIDNDVLFVNVSVRYPNGSVQVANTSLVSGLWESASFVAWNGSTQVNVSHDEGFAGSLSFVVYDFTYITPPDFVQISAGENFSFNVNINTNSSANLSFSSVCVLNDTWFNCSLSPNPLSVVVSGNLTVSIATSPSTPNGSYSGQLNITRVFDGKVFSLPISLGIANTFGKPFLSNKEDWSAIMPSSITYAKVFSLFNNGSYPLSACQMSFDKTLAGKSFVIFSPSNLSVPAFESRNITISFVNPTVGFYQGQLNVECVATPSGLLNSLPADNRPNAFLFSYPIQQGGGAGGGGGGSQVVYVTGAQNQTLFSLETDTGALASDLFMYPAQERTQSLIIRSYVANDLALKASCAGSFCSNVRLSKESFTLSGKSEEVVSVLLSMPENAVFGSVFDYNIQISDGQGHSAVVVSQVSVSKFSAWYSKFALFVEKGDAGYLFSLGSFNVPKIVLYLMILGFVEFVLYFSIPKDKRYRDWKQLAYVVVGLGTVLFSSLLI
jgi:hypothetical protein